MLLSIQRSKQHFYSMKQELEKTVQVTTGRQNYTTHIQARTHTLLSDEPLSEGGADNGATPYELLLASLGSCTAITLRMYAERKQWDIGGVNVLLSMEQETTETGKNTVFNRSIQLTGTISNEQRVRLLAIAKACPVAKVLSGSIDIKSTLV